MKKDDMLRACLHGGGRPKVSEVTRLTMGVKNILQSWDLEVKFFKIVVTLEIVKLSIITG